MLYVCGTPLYVRAMKSIYEYDIYGKRNCPQNYVLCLMSLLQYVNSQRRTHTCRCGSIYMLRAYYRQKHTLNMLLCVSTLNCMFASLLRPGYQYARSSLIPSGFAAQFYSTSWLVKYIQTTHVVVDVAVHLRQASRASNPLFECMDNHICIKPLCISIHSNLIINVQRLSSVTCYIQICLHMRKFCLCMRTCIYHCL